MDFNIIYHITGPNLYELTNKGNLVPFVHDLRNYLCLDFGFGLQRSIKISIPTIAIIEIIVVIEIFGLSRRVKT